MSFWALAGSAFTALANRWGANDQMDFQKDMSNTQYQRAARDLEAAGLNRVLALGSPASSPQGASFQSPDFGDTYTKAASAKAAIEQAEAQTDKTRNEADLADMQKDVVPLTMQVAAAQAARERTQAELNAEQRRLVSAEADKAEVTRSIYSAVEPVVERGVSWLRKNLSSAFQSKESLEEAARAGAHAISTNSAVAGRELDVFSDKAKVRFDGIRLIQYYERNPGMLPRLKNENPRVLQYVLERRPEWRKYRD